MVPKIGQVVVYTLTQENANQINRRRTDSLSIHERMVSERWPAGAQAHIGNFAFEGQELPMVIVRLWPDEFGRGTYGVNGQVLMDGTDSLWITSVYEGFGPGHFHAVEPEPASDTLKSTRKTRPNCF